MKWSNLLLTHVDIFLQFHQALSLRSFAIIALILSTTRLNELCWLSRIFYQFLQDYLLSRLGHVHKQIIYNFSIGELFSFTMRSPLWTATPTEGCVIPRRLPNSGCRNPTPAQPITKSEIYFTGVSQKRIQQVIAVSVVAEYLPSFNAANHHVVDHAWSI